MNRWMHQKISANDCYSTFEHVFEYVSHYDFDEIIYPRSNETDIFLKENENCEAKDFCMEFEHEKKLDLCNYTDGIIHLEYIQKLYETFYKINCIYEKIDLQIDSSLDSNFNFYDSFFKQVLPRSYKKFFLNRSAHILCGKTVCHLRQNFSQEMLGKFLRNLLENY